MKYGKVPVVFIDGIDLLVNRNSVLCEVLITLAKVLTNAETPKLVLVSSEGTIMPFLERMSATNRVLICEINDVDEKDVDYLVKNNIGRNRAKNVVRCIGGRLVYQSYLKLDNPNKLEDDQ